MPTHLVLTVSERSTQSQLWPGGRLSELVPDVASAAIRIDDDAPSTSGAPTEKDLAYLQKLLGNR